MEAAHLQVKRRFILMDLLKTVFGIDVSSRKSNVCIMVNGQKVDDYAISNDMVGFNQLLDDLKQVTKPQIIFEATGVYSRRLQAFLDMHELRYVMMNPLEARQRMTCTRTRPISLMPCTLPSCSLSTRNGWPTFKAKNIKN